MSKNRVTEILRKHETDILDDWIRQQSSATGLRSGLIRESELREQSREFLGLFIGAVASGELDDIMSSNWAGVREMLVGISSSRAKMGFTPSETAVFIFSLKLPLFTRMRAELGDDAETFSTEFWQITTVLDKLGLWTTEVFQKSRDQIISRQQQELLELSTPVVSLWDGVLALPLIGTLDSARTQIVMENLLQQIVDTEATIAIIDITGVPTVDTLVAQHLLKTVAAARLMGADCIISGIRPQIAQTIVHLGVELNDVITKATLSAAFAIALQRRGLAVLKGRQHVERHTNPQ